MKNNATARETDSTLETEEGKEKENSCRQKFDLIEWERYLEQLDELTQSLEIILQ